MKKLLLFAALLCALSVPKTVYASETDELPEYKCMINYGGVAYLDGEAYEEVENLDDEIMYNDSKHGYEENLDDFDAVSQFEDEIYNHKNSAGKKWNDRACVATSVSLMITRKAYLDGFDYNGDIFSDDAVIEVLQEISNQSTMFRQSDKNLYWQGYCYVYSLTKDDEPYYAQIETYSSSEDNLKALIDEHPEGVLVLGSHNSWKHGVLVTNYYDDGTYEVYDSASGTVEYREYNYINGYKNSSSSYKFASLANGMN